MVNVLVNAGEQLNINFVHDAPMRKRKHMRLNLPNYEASIAMMMVRSLKWFE